jgi:hypothetical protein
MVNVYVHYTICNFSFIFMHTDINFKKYNKYSILINEVYNIIIIVHFCLTVNQLLILTCVLFAHKLFLIILMI